ncbi:hypothetical protein ROA7450_01566 [Roseovarius albus]|uniref:Uncharacterized protein n=1 Tax=Roseovarius albus TaxID=1247867 RepID=A0A1X6YYH0_9RHOB|nr:hypothetical protein [Roseovarius albus]SLN34551.1 hypothetical protein ROA7450_01566 [Roseovarius albus]
MIVIARKTYEWMTSGLVGPIFCVVILTVAIMNGHHWIRQQGVSPLIEIAILMAGGAAIGFFFIKAAKVIFEGKD